MPKADVKRRKARKVLEKAKTPLERAKKAVRAKVSKKVQKATQRLKEPLAG